MKYKFSVKTVKYFSFIIIIPNEGVAYNTKELKAIHT